MPTIIMTIKRRHLRNMESGIKRWELRKTLPRVKEGQRCRVLLCESGGRGEIAGEFEMDTYRDLTDVEPTELARMACITAAEADGYRRKGRGKLYGWHVTRFRRYPVEGSPSHINDVGLSRPPQSWQYVRVPYGELKID
jgi:predicted transcriptional regulator